MSEFELPKQISILLHARNQVRSYYKERLEIQGSDAELKFTLDGNLVGDIGEAIAVELFGVRLVPGKSTEGIDGYSPDSRYLNRDVTMRRRSNCIWGKTFQAKQIGF